MYYIYTTDFEDNTVEYAKTASYISVKDIYSSLLKRCLYGFPNIMIITVKKDSETISSFVNWRR